MMKYCTLLTFFLSTFSASFAQPKNQFLSASTDTVWWKNAVVYQIYPRSFKDSNGDGVGDLNGINQKLDYLKSLGVDAVWLNPIYTSPNDDNGYDVSDYVSIQPEFGTMADFDNLLNGLHKRGIKLIMDVVVNHSSDEHYWFKQSRSSRDNPYRNYYHWWPAEKGKPNYRYSLFDSKGDAWQYDSLTNAYYLHYFSHKQPDLNWNNPKLRQEVYDIMKFWAKKGVDGFRLDAFQFAYKDTSFPVFPKGFEKNFIRYYGMQGDIHQYLKEMNEQVFTPYNAMSVAEGAGNNFQDAHDLVDEERKELSMAYAFDAVDLAKPEGYSLIELKTVFSKWDSAFAKKGWISIFLANHDQARIVSRYGNDAPKYRAASAKMLHTLLLTMRGTPYIYYGDEIGMTNIGFEKIEEYKDNTAHRQYQKVKFENGDTLAYLRYLKAASRDNGRTPMQWNATKNAGFTTGTPWIPVNKNYLSINVAKENSIKNSVLEYFIKLIETRKKYATLRNGSYKLLDKNNPKVYAYLRKDNKKSFLVVLNFSKDNTIFNNLQLKKYRKIVLNNYASMALQSNSLKLFPYQALILEQ